MSENKTIKDAAAKIVAFENHIETQVQLIERQYDVIIKNIDLNRITDGQGREILTGVTIDAGIKT